MTRLALLALLALAACGAAGPPQPPAPTPSGISVTAEAEMGLVIR